MIGHIKTSALTVGELVDEMLQSNTINGYQTLDEVRASNFATERRLDTELGKFVDGRLARLADIAESRGVDVPRLWEDLHAELLQEIVTEIQRRHDTGELNIETDYPSILRGLPKSV